MKTIFAKLKPWMIHFTHPHQLHRIRSRRDQVCHDLQDWNATHIRGRLGLRDDTSQSENVNTHTIGILTVSR